MADENSLTTFASQKTQKTVMSKLKNKTKLKVYYCLALALADRSVVLCLHLYFKSCALFSVLHQKSCNIAPYSLIYIYLFIHNIRLLYYL